MSSSVSCLASPRMFKTLVLLIGTLGQQLFAQQTPAPPSPKKARYALMDSSQALSGKTGPAFTAGGTSSGKATPAFTVSGNVSSNVTPAKADVGAQNRAQLQYLHLPLAFEKNQGQAESHVKFLSRGAGYGLFLTDREAVLSFGGQKASSIKLQFLGADSKSTVDATDRLPGTSNYFLGNDRARWHTNVPNFGRVEYKNLYSGIDLVYYGNQQKIEHDFVVAPHANAAKIRFAIDGAKKLALEKSGDLVVTTSSGELRLRKPAIYQTVNGERKEIAGGYAMKHGNQVAFVLGAYDRERELTIDPVLILSTYLADAAGVSASAVTVDGSGIYVTGNTRAASFNSVSPTLNNRGNQSVPNDDIYVVKLDPTGNHLIYLAIIGGAGTDNATSIAVDGSGNAYVGGFTQSADFPVLATSGSNTPYQNTIASTQDGFFLQLNSGGNALSYSSYFGGAGNNDAVNGIAVNGGQIYLTGKTDSSTGISTTNSFQPALAGTALNAFVAAISPAGNGTNDLTYGTYLGGTASDSGNAIAVSGANGVFVTGNASSSNFPVSDLTFLGTQTQDAFIARIDTTNSAVNSATCLDGTTHTDQITTAAPHTFVVGEIVVVSGLGAGSGGTTFNGQVKITAIPDSSTIQYVDSSCTSNGDAGTGSASVTGGRVFATYFGGGATGTTSTSGNAIALDGSGNAYITGQTSATAGIATGGVFQNALNGTSDAYIAKFDGTGSVTYGTYLGGTADEQGNAIAVDAGGNTYVAGFTTSPAGLATANALFGTFAGTQDAFVAKVNSTATTLIYSTYLGGTGSNDSANTIAVNPSGVNSSNVPVAVVAGNTSSSAFPTTASAFQPSATGSNAFVASLDAADSDVVLSFDPLTGVSPATVRADSHTQDQITYQYVIANTSAANSALNTVFNDLKPSGVTLGTANFKSGTSQLTCPLTAPTDCSLGSGGVTCHLGTLSDTTTNTSQFATVCITATPTSTTPATTITNANATVAAANAGSVLASPLTTTVVNSTQVTVTAAQTSPTGNATVADTNTFRDRLTLHNDGPNDIQAGQAQFVISVNSASNASLSGIAVTPNDPADDCGAGPGNPATTLPATCTLGAVTNATNHTFDISATITLTSGHTGSVTIQGTVSSTNSTQFQLDSTSTLSATQTTNVATEADLSTAVTGTNPVDSGSPASFTVSVNSAASFTAGSATMNADTVTAVLTVIITPTTANYTSVTITPQNGDNCGDGVNAPHPVTVSGVTPVTCNLSSIAAGSTHQFALSGTGAIAGVATAGSIRVDATIAPAAGPTYTDVNTGNDAAGTFTSNLTSAADLTTLVAPPTQTVNNGTANTTLTVTVSNVAGSSIPSTQLSGTLVLTNSSFGTVTLQPGDPGDDCGAGPGVLVTLAGNTFTCALSRLDVGTPHIFTVNGTPSITGTNVSGSVRLDATLTALSTYTELHLGDESSSAIVNITPVADLSSTTSGTASLNSGAPASFNIQVSDGGPNSVAGTTVSGQITITNANFTPTLTPQVGDSCSVVTYGGGNPNIGTFTCTLGQINAGFPHTISVSGTATITGTFTTGSVKVEVLTLAGSYFDPNTLGRGVNNDPSTSTTTLIPVADLTSSTSGAASVNSGSPASFTLQISDVGPNSVAGTTLSGKIAVNNASFTPTLTPQVGDSCSMVTFGGGNPNVGTFTCTLGQIDTGSPHTVTVSGNPAITGTFTSGSIRVDVLTLTGGYSDPNPGNDASNFTTNLVPVAHLSTVLTRNTAGTLQEGDPISYTLTVSNSGPNYLASAAAKVTGTFAGSGTPVAPNSVINGLAFSGCASSTVNIPNPGDYVCILPATNVAAPAVTISITGTAHVTSGILDVLNGGSTAAPNNSGYSESSPGTTSATAPSTSIQPKTHLSTSITRNSPSAVKEGDTVSYTIHVASSAMNLAASAGVIGGTFVGSGSTTAPNSTITGMTLANCVSFTVDSPNPGNFTCVLPAVTVATGADIIVSGTAHVITGIQDTLTGTTTAASNGNNYFETLPVATSSNAPATVIRPATDLQPSIPTAPSILQNGQTASYVVQVTNNGLTPANDLASGAAKVLIAFTGNNSSFSITTAPGCTTISSSSVSCVLGALNAGQNQQFTIAGVASLSSGSSDTLTLTATVSPNNSNDYFDSNTTNDTNTASVSIKGVSNLTLTFTGSATPVLVGNNLTYSITVSNASTASTAAGVNVTVPLGTAGQTFVPASSSSNCSILPADVAANIVTCQIGNAGVVPAGSTFTATVVVLASPAVVPDNAAGTPRQATYAQSATVNVDAAQTVNSNAGNNTQSVNSTFQAAAHITVAHTNSTAPALIDGSGTTYNNVVYTTLVTNVAGRSAAKGVVITDNPPIGPNVTFVSATVTGGSCSGSGPVSCTIPLLASGNTATVTITVRPVRLASVPPVSITDTTSYAPSDVIDPTPNPSDTTNTSTIQVQNTISGGTLPLQDASSGRLATVVFGTANQTGVTSFSTSSLSGVVLDSRYPLAAQPGTSLLYNFHTTASISGPVTFCFTPVQNFLKPERVRVFLISGGGSTDITSSITPAAPNRATGVTQVCGSTPFVSDVSLAVLEPKNNPPVLQFIFNPSSAGKGVTGSFVDLNPSGSFDPDVNPCNGNATLCSDTSQLRFYFFFIPFSGSVSSTAANPVVTASLPSGTTSIVVAAVDQTVPVPSVVNTPDDLKNLPNAQTGLTISSFAATTDSTGGTVNSTTQTVLAGQSTSFSFHPTTPTGAPLQGNAVLTFSCSNGSTTPNLDSVGIKCAINPPTFDISSSSTAVLLISTTGATLGQTQPAPGAPLYAAWIAFAGMPFAGIVIISGFGPGRRRRWLKLLLAFGLLVVAIGSQVACGGGSMKPPSPSFATPRGNYEIVVTGTQNGTALSKNSFTITVQ